MSHLLASISAQPRALVGVAIDQPCRIGSPFHPDLAPHGKNARSDSLELRELQTFRQPCAPERRHEIRMADTRWEFVYAEPEIFEATQGLAGNSTTSGNLGVLRKSGRRRKNRTSDQEKGEVMHFGLRHHSTI